MTSVTYVTSVLIHSVNNIKLLCNNVTQQKHIQGAHLTGSNHRLAIPDLNIITRVQPTNDVLHKLLLV